MMPSAECYGAFPCCDHCVAPGRHEHEGPCRYCLADDPEVQAAVAVLAQRGVGIDGREHTEDRHRSMT